MDRLEQYIERSGLKKQFIADQLGITRASLRNKMSRVHPFTVDEAIRLKGLLGINDKDFQYIFGK